MKKIILVLCYSMVVTTLLASCATQRFPIHGGGGDEPDKQKMQSFFIGGIGQEQEIDAAEICGGADKVARVEAHLRFIDGFLGVLTWGLYTPRTAKVYCTE
jgi:hypothetical protein